jgi:type VI secretion system protein ImpE
VSGTDAAELSLKNGDPAAALAQLQEQIKAQPANAKLRIFLFQLLCVLGQWERALNQLKVASGLDASALAMAQMYGEAVRCEAIRNDVFAGRKSPMIFGEPEQWLALLIESLLVAGRGNAAQSEELRLRAFEEAETSPGDLNGQPFEWVADADSRLGPVLEAVINGRYYWVPFARLASVTIEEPEDLRDMVWMPAHLQFENGGEQVALIPTRYPARARAADPRDGQRGRAPDGGARARHSQRRGRGRSGRRRRRPWLSSSRRRNGCSLRSSTGSPTTSRTRSWSRASTASCRRTACARACCAISPGCSTPPSWKRARRWPDGRTRSDR